MGEEPEVKKGTEDLGIEIPDNLSETVTNILQSTLKTGMLPKEALGFSDEKIENMYGEAYRLYNTGKYEEAAQIFRLLTVLDLTDSKYALGLAACFHMLQDYANAVQTYGLVGVMDPESPVAYFHASDCYIQMREPAAAILCLEMAIKRSGNKPEFQLLKERALLTIESLKKEIMQSK